MSSSETFVERRRWLTHYAPLVVWIFVILGLGSSVGSMNETSRFIRPLLEFLFPETSAETLAYLHGYVRKFAHFAEYALLALLAFRVFRTFFAHILNTCLYAFLLTAAIAVMDEYQQSFNPLRTSSPYDVLIDLAGSVTMLTIVYFAARQRR